ncbi:NEDD8-activating enzyme E1 regulatory subunit [Labeo rohita]|uniref:NEDD8-activating enzyme E1 regulatory subunit n=1 Tax=Labeo rohita TaxID=84645 RepID=A0ABQ8MHY3_LABRO|nr:NEDD8-activating enzyme E1 regulatory subunit [Labeo rohita]
MTDHKTSKEQKYDRQLRLWGDHGQEALENAHVCLINATSTGTEILKNLVLPGIGAFTIVDGHKVSGEDVGNNFFLTSSSIGKNRAQAATELLQELNSDVSGNFVEELLDNDPEFFHRFSLVIGVQLPESTCLRLGCVLWEAGVPFLVCRTYGLIGYMRLIVKEHTVVESHPDNALEDLRLDQPFTELKHHVESYDLDNMEKKDHSHTPWIIVVAKYLEKWYSEHNSQLPKNYKEKEAFRQLIREGIFKNENGTPEDEENFEEAIKNVNTALNPTKVELLTFEKLYRDKAMKDATVVSKHVEALLQSVGKPPESISEQEIKLFCKNAAFLRVVRCRSLAEEYSVDTFNKDEISVYNYQVEEDINKLKLCVNSLLQEYSLNVNVKDDYIHEFCRYGAAEPHTVAAFLGGSAAQEAIKIITHQFVPFNNTFLYNAMSQTSATFQL